MNISRTCWFVGLLCGFFTFVQPLHAQKKKKKPRLKSEMITSPDSDIFFVPGNIDTTEPDLDENNPQIPVSAKELEALHDIQKQLQEDVAPIPPKLGGIFVPNLAHESSTQNPAYVVYNKYNQIVAIARTGKKAFVLPGKYRVRIGRRTTTSALADYQIVVREGQYTILRPRWGVLIVRVVDERLIGIRGNYDLISLDTRRVIGTGLGADENLGEKVRPWLLPPGRYMLVRVGDSYLARTNFFTVQVNASEVTHFRLVIDKNSNQFLGGGALTPRQTTSQSGNWRWSIQLSVNLIWSQEQNVSASDGQRLSLTSFTYGRLTYSTRRHFFLTTFNAEIGFTASNITDFQKGADFLQLQSLYIFRINKSFGPYARAVFESNLFPNQYRFQKTFTGQAGSIYHCNSLTCQLSSTFKKDELTELELNGSFDPINLKQGFGINYQVIRTTWLDLRILAGLGLREQITRGSFQMDPSKNLSESRCIDKTRIDPKNPVDTTGCPTPPQQEPHSTVMLFKTDNSFRIGTEFGLVAAGKIGRYLNFTTEFDALGQFTDFLNFDIDWRTSIALRLSHYASVIYRLNIRRDPGRRSAVNPSPWDEWSLEQSVILTLSLLF